MCVSCYPPDAALGTKTEAICVEPLGLLAAALRELRTTMTDPTQYDGEDVAVGRAIGNGCSWAEPAVARAQWQSVVVKPDHSHLLLPSQPYIWGGGGRQGCALGFPVRRHHLHFPVHLNAFLHL